MSIEINKIPDISDKLDKKNISDKAIQTEHINTTITPSALITEKKKKSKSKKRKRCNMCNKKLPLIPITCKCEKEFCNSCRLPESHNCTYDYKKDKSQILSSCGGGKFSKIDKIE